MKLGSPQQRASVAQYVRKQRAKWPRFLCCPGTRRSWYAFVIQEAHNKLAALAAVDRRTV